MRRNLVYRSSPEKHSMLLSLTAGIEYIARIVGRREIEEARKRITLNRRRWSPFAPPYYYRPSVEYMSLRQTLFKAKTKKYARIIGKSPFKEDNESDGKCHSIGI